MSKKRIVHIVPDVSPGGGPAGYNFHLAKAFGQFPSSEYDVFFYTYKSLFDKHRPESFTEKIRSRVMQKIRSWKFPYSTALKYDLDSYVNFALLGNNDFDSIWSSNLIIVHHLLVAEKLIGMRKGTAQIAIMSHGPTPFFAEVASNYDSRLSLENCISHPIISKYLEWELGIYDKVDHIIAPCEEALESYINVSNHWKTVIENKTKTCLTGAYPPQKLLTREEWRKRLGVSENCKLIVFIGRNHPHKGYDLALSAARKLARSSGQPFKMVFAGGREISENGPISHIGYIQDVGGLLEAADLFVSANRHSYFDLSMIEAISIGTPALMTQVGGSKKFRDLVPEIRMADPTEYSLFEAMKRFIETPYDPRISAGIKGGYGKFFDPKSFANNHIKMYKQILG